MNNPRAWRRRRAHGASTRQPSRAGIGFCHRWSYSRGWREARVSLRWAGSESTDTFRALLALNRAEDWDAFRTALADWATPALIFTFADADGNIGYCVAGRRRFGAEAAVWFRPPAGIETSTGPVSFLPQSCRMSSIRHPGMWWRQTPGWTRPPAPTNWVRKLIPDGERRDWKA